MGETVKSGEQREKHAAGDPCCVALPCSKYSPDNAMRLCTENSKSQTVEEIWQARVPCGFEVRPSFCVMSVCSVSFSGSVRLYEKLYLLWWVGQARPGHSSDARATYKVILLLPSAGCHLSRLASSVLWMNEKLVDGVDWNELWLGKAPSQAERKIRDGLEDYGGRTLR